MTCDHTATAGPKRSWRWNVLFAPVRSRVAHHRKVRPASIGAGGIQVGISGPSSYGFGMYWQVLIRAHGGSACAGAAARRPIAAPANTMAPNSFTAIVFMATPSHPALTTSPCRHPQPNRNYGRAGNALNHPSESNSNSCPSGSRIIAAPADTDESTTDPPNSATRASTPGRSDTDNEMCVRPIWSITRSEPA